MGKTIFTTSNALTKKAFDEQLYRDTIVESCFSKFMSEGDKNIIHVKNDLNGKKGDKVTFGIRMRLTGNGVTEGQILEGNEESLSTYSDDVILGRKRHAVRDNGALDRQRAVFSISDEARDALKDWGAEKIDKMCIEALDATATQVGYLTSDTAYANTATLATAKSALTTSSILTPNFLTFLSTMADLGSVAGVNRSFVPIRPVKVDGRPMYVLLTNPRVLYGLKTNASFIQAMREAEVRGKDNPLFKNAVAIWGNVIVHEHEFVSTGSNAGASANIPYATSYLMGAQALCWAWGQKPKTVYKQFDYDEEDGWAWGMTAGVTKPQFNSKDYGSITVLTYSNSSI